MWYRLLHHTCMIHTICILLILRIPSEIPSMPYVKSASYWLAVQIASLTIGVFLPLLLC